MGRDGAVVVVAKSSSDQTLAEVSATEKEIVKSRVKAIKTTGEVRWFESTWQAEGWLDEEGRVDP